jgi:Icc-related predicted phosphoesterase
VALVLDLLAGGRQVGMPALGQPPPGQLHCPLVERRVELEEQEGLLYVEDLGHEPSNGTLPSMRILAFSDLHRDLGQAVELVRMAGEADVVVGAGDFASVHEGLEETIAALRPIDKPTVLVPGNNETEDELRAAVAGWEAATVLHGEGLEIDGTAFFGLGGGVPVTPWDWSFDLTDEEAAQELRDCPEGGVLVVHSPPKGHLDQGLGSEAILRTVEEKQPKIAVFGHIHECAGRQEQLGPTLLANLGPSGTILAL